MSIDIDKKIKHLEQQLKDLEKQKKRNEEHKIIEKLNRTIAEAIERNYKIKSIYVSSKIYNACISFFQRINNIMTPYPFNEPPIKYRGFRIYSNIYLKDEEIEIVREDK